MKAIGKFTVIMLALLFACLVAALVSGCATAGSEESEIPWNTPQPWEGAPMLPGFEPR